MKRVIKITAAAGLAFLLLLSLGAISSAEEASGEDEFRVIGYYSADLFDEPVEMLQTDKLTHVMYAFLIPQSDGTCLPPPKPDQLRALVAQAHRDGAEVFAALGGCQNGTIFFRNASLFFFVWQREIKPDASVDRTECKAALRGFDRCLVSDCVAKTLELQR